LNRKYRREQHTVKAEARSIEPNSKHEWVESEQL
jgi:hypothetical protein